MGPKMLSIMLALAPLCGLGQNQSTSLTVEKIMRDPKWIGTSPSHVFWSADGQSIYFNWNPENVASDSVYSYNIHSKITQKVNFRETELAHAIGQGAYSADRSKIAYILRGDLYFLDLLTKKTIRITKSSDSKSDPSFCNHDQWVTYINNDNLYAWDIRTGLSTQLTLFLPTDTPSSKHAASEEYWLRNEQNRTSDVLRKRNENRLRHDANVRLMQPVDTIKKIYIGAKKVTQLQISPDGRYITYDLVEEPTGAKRTVVPEYVTESGFTQEIPGRTKAGAPQATMSLFFYDRLKDSVGRVVSDQLPGITDPPDYMKDYPIASQSVIREPREVYFDRISWNEGSTVAVVNILSADFKDRWIMLLDPATGKLHLADRQRDEAWIVYGWDEEETMPKWIDQTTFYFLSEATGYSHLYTFNTATGTRHPITRGDYEVHDVQLSHDKRFFYFVTNEDHPGKMVLCRIDVTGTQKQRISTIQGGFDNISISPDDRFMAFRYSYQNRPWELYLQGLAPISEALEVTHKAMSEEWRNYPWRDTKIFTFKARDGQPVYARIYEPASSRKNNAAVIFVHGAGYLQNVDYWWSYYYREMMFNNLLADAGYTVMDIDYRGSAGYGRNWRTGIYRHMGGKDLDDEVDAARWLVSSAGIDSSRIGMYGGSYGGFMTLMAMFTQPDVFKAGAALRPVTDWAHYDHQYTCAILNEPMSDSLAYQTSSPINYVSGLKNHLLICHGMVDVNVHFQDAVRLAQRLIELGKDNWDLAVYPVEDHSFIEPTSWTDEYKRVYKLFNQALK